MNNNFVLGNGRKEIKLQKDVVNFTDVHDKLTLYKLGLIKKEDVEAWLNDVLEVRDYMSVTEKYAVINIFRQNFEVDFLTFDNGYKTLEKEFISMQFTIRLFFDLMLRYTNIFVLDKYKTDTNYDLVVSTGFYDMLFNLCKDDYLLLETYCKEAIDLSNNSLYKLLESLVMSAPTVEDAEKVKDMLNDIDKDKLEILEAVQKYNNAYLDDMIKNEGREIIENEKKEKELIS